MFQVKKIPALHADFLLEAGSLLQQLPPQPIVCNNWPAQYPYSPLTSFRIAHNGKEIFLRFDVRENNTMALVSENNGPVCTDSCVEFFFAPDKEGYYNFEFNCIGKIRLGFRKTPADKTHAETETLRSIKCLSSLGTANFPECRGNNRWTLLVSIPVGALFRHRYQNFSGMTARANLYKCGDHLSVPHFLSWCPIDSPAPDFHQPRFFTDIEFQ